MLLLSCDHRVHALLARRRLRLLRAAIEVLEHRLHCLLLLFVQNERQSLILWDVRAEPGGGIQLFLMLLLLGILDALPAPASGGDLLP
jgi:hypothetical protein